nr:putative neural-cadherin 2 [Penaeus vannamei]
MRLVFVQGASVLVDFCGRGWEANPPDDSHCLARAPWARPGGAGPWLGSGPLQLGGLAHARPRPEDHGWTQTPTATPLDGCISHLRIDGQPCQQLGRLRAQDAACPGGVGGCGHRGRCVGGLVSPECECEPGWTAPGCTMPTVPASLGPASYMKVALSFAAAGRGVRVQVRVRTRGARDGLLLHLAARHRRAALSLHTLGFRLAAKLANAHSRLLAAAGGRRLRLGVGGRLGGDNGVRGGTPLGDGAWHTLRAERHGHNLVVSVDDGDAWRRNESLVSLGKDAAKGVSEQAKGEPPAPLVVDKHDGVTLGGLPEFMGVNLVSVHEDLQDACVDDLRVSGHHMPIPPEVNGTSWGQVTTLEGMEQGCHVPDGCVNTTCNSPLTCHSTWSQTGCSCGPGRHLVGRTCEDVDECAWSPCLHGGTCYNLRPGFLCECGPAHLGTYCQWTRIPSSGHPLAAPAAIAALTLSLLALGQTPKQTLCSLWPPVW